MTPTKPTAPKEHPSASTAFLEMRKAAFALKAAESLIGETVKFSSTSGDRLVYQDALRMQGALRAAYSPIEEYINHWNKSNQTVAGTQAHDKAVQKLADSLSATFHL